MGIDWQDIEEAFTELQAARETGGDTSVLMRLDEMKMALSEAIDAHVTELVTRRALRPWSWQEVGNALGITRQAASKRWGKKVWRDHG